MHAIRQHAFGGPDTLSYESVPDLDPADGQVRILVEAAGVHLLDTKIRSGESGGPFPLPDLPMTPGREVAGARRRRRLRRRRLVDRQARRRPPRPGQRRLRRTGARACDSLHELRRACRPRRRSPWSGRAARPWASSRWPTSGEDVVLVTAAAGGLGALLVQAAKAAGAVAAGAGGRPGQGRPRPRPGRRRRRQLPVARLARRPARRARGAGDARRGRAVRAPGHRAARRRRRRGRPGGARPRPSWRPRRDVRLDGGHPDLDHHRGPVRPRHHRLGRRRAAPPPAARRTPRVRTAALTAAADGRLTPLTTSFPLAEAGAAHQALTDRATTGKVVLIP